MLFVGILYLPICTYGQVAGPKNYKLTVSLENAHFDSLYLHDYTENRHVVIAGKKMNKFTWEITIPDTVVANSEEMQLLASPYDSKNNSLQAIRFISNRSGKRTIIANVGIDGKDNYISGSYIDTAQFGREKVIERSAGRDSVVVGHLICQDFNLIIKDNNSDIAVRALDPFFSWFMSPAGQNISYDDHLKSYIHISKAYPNSRFLMENLATNLTLYKTKDDVRKVYDNFSNKYKNTIWAKNIERFLYSRKFENTSLPTGRPEKYENVVQDKSKFNLIVFTASWCVPCIKEIPLLKNIYNDLGKNLVLTYISIDNAQGVGSFQKLIQQQNIPWRTLYAYQNVKEIRQRYFVEAIPYAILVYPNQDTEVIEVRKEEDSKRLYSLVKALKN